MWAVNDKFIIFYYTEHMIKNDFPNTHSGSQILLQSDMPFGDAADRMTDEELVVHTLRDPEYFRLLMKRYEKPLARYVVRIMPSMRDSVDDLLQEIFIKTYLHLNDFDGTRKFSSWIYRIAHNQVVSSLRKVKSRPSTVSMEGEEYGAFLKSAVREYSDGREAMYAKEEVEKVLNSLEDRYREIMSLWYMEGKRYQEISKILGKPIGSVGVLIRRAKEKFKERYVQEFESGYSEERVMSV